MSARYGFVTLVTSDSYLPGALAVAAALKEVHPSPPVYPEVPFQTVCLITPETVDVKTVKRLRKAFDLVVGVEVIDGQSTPELHLLGRPDLHSVLTKLHVFRLTQFDKIIFLDADVLPIRPLSHLFTLPHEFSAVPDVGWPDIFNSGMMVLSPGEDKFNEIMGVVKTKGSWDGGDQGVLNEWRGSDWNRLSFTYNTTPTAAYTYAPAYERFGSQISAIHFIGTNKPWNEIPYRAPSSVSQAQHHGHPASSTNTTSTSASTAPLQSYGYGSLVDRWFDVYDRNYRRPISEVQPKRESSRYENVWDDKPAPAPEIVSGGALGLEDLRKLALEGGSSASRREGEGAYRSLPLEGRIDLMRPRQEPVRDQITLHVEGDLSRVSVPSEEHVRTPTVERPEWLGHVPSERQQAATPAPHEVPPSPHLAPLSLPASGAVSPAFGLQSLPDSDQAGSHGQPREEPREEKGVKTGAQLEAGPSTAVFQSEPSHVMQENQENQRQEFQQQIAPSQVYHQPPSGEPKRPASPPLISWNPAIEPPPNVPPTPSAFPADAYFPNAWDMPDKPHDAGPTSISSQFFEPPPQSQIPQQLIKEGHYANVTGHQQDKAPEPDIGKVTSIFPWERKPRRLPGRVFPETDPTPPGFKYIENMPPTEPEQESEVLTPETIQEEKVQVVSPQMQLLSPPIGFAGAGGFANAWDSVPSIQKYAARLVKPTTTSFPIAMQPPRLRKRTDSYRSRGEQSDANSMDGDVEDEIDDNESEADAGGRFSSSERSTSGRSRKGSRASITSPPSGTGRSKAGKKEYRSYGVQTVPKDVRSVGVQVSEEISASTGKSSGKHAPKPDSPTKLSLAKPHIELPKQPAIQEMQMGPEPTALATPSSSNVESFMRIQTIRQQQVIPSGMVSPRLHEAYGTGSPNRTPPNASPGTQSPVSRRPAEKLKLPQLSIEQQPQLLARSVTRTSSQDTADSPVGPVSPVDFPSGQPKKPARRKWDPATGVDVFKRGSEEVLARFLRLGSWDDDSQPSGRSHG